MAGEQLGGLREDQLIQKLEEEGMKKRKERRKEQSSNVNGQGDQNQAIEDMKNDGGDASAI